MKKINTIIFFCIIGMLGWGCDDEPSDDSSRDGQLEVLQGTWSAEQVTDGVEYREDYDDFTITFDKATMTYTTAGGPDKYPFPETAGFELGEDIEHQLVLDPPGANILVDYIFGESQTSMTFGFHYEGTGFANSRTKVVAGDWIFELVQE